MASQIYQTFSMKIMESWRMTYSPLSLELLKRRRGRAVLRWSKF